MIYLLVETWHAGMPGMEFVALCFAAYIVATHLWYKQRIKKIIAQQQQALKKERQRISSEIHDDIGAGFFAIKLFADVISKNDRDKEDMFQLSIMINELSEKIKEIIWSTNYENDNLENLIYYVEFQTRKLFDHSPAALLVEVPYEIPERTISTDVRKNIYLIIKEFIHNAIRHSHATNIGLLITVNADTLEIFITDDGIGFDPVAVKVNSTGLRNVKTRLDMLSGSMKMDSLSGTQIRLSIPLPK